MGDRVTVTAVAEHLGVPRGNLSNILNGKLGISAAVALSLRKLFQNRTPSSGWRCRPSTILRRNAKRSARKLAACSCGIRPASIFLLTIRMNPLRSAKSCRTNP